MEKTQSNYSRRSFLKTTAITGGGLMISFSWLSGFAIEDKASVLDLPGEWRFMQAGILENLY